MPHRDFRRLAYFVQVIESGSIRGAARQLGLSAPVVSAALADLEAELAVTLVIRGARRVSLTPDGQRLYDEAASTVAALDRTLEGFRAGRLRPKGRVAVTLPTELSIFWLPPILLGFEARYPEVRPVIHALESTVDLVGSDFDLAIRAFYTEPGAVALGTIALLPLTLVVAPATAGRGSLADRLQQVPVIGFTWRAGRDTIVARGPGGRILRLPVVPRFFVNNGLVAKELAKLGFGAALAIEAAVAEDLAAGRLVRMSQTHDFGSVGLKILMRDRMPSPAARAFAAFVEERAAPAAIATDAARGRS